MTKTPDQQIADIPDTMGFDQALHFAANLLRDGQHLAAAPIFAALDEAAPGHPDVVHFLGIVEHRSGNLAEAAALIRLAIGAVPDFPDYHLNLGNVLVELGDIDGALAEFEETRRLRPDSADAWSNLGSMYRATGRVEEAEKAYRRAIELDASHVGAHNNLGVLFTQRGEPARALEYFCKAIVLSPRHADSYRLLGIAHAMLGQLDEAAAVYRRWLEIEPDNPVPRHQLAACLGTGTPARASDDYVVRTFDDFAASFENQLQNQLNYRAPQLLADLIAERLPPAARQFAVLDAGCGTGLCGPLLAGWAAQLCGVDLSEGMLAKAAEKGCYDLLLAGELSEFLSDSPGAFELVASADTLCYFGSLGKVLPAAARSLRAGGVLAFTVEQLAPGSAADGFRLMPHGRYAHSRAYVGATLAEAGFELLRLEDAHLRVEGGEPVLGLVAVARRPARAADEPGGPAR